MVSNKNQYASRRQEDAINSTTCKVHFLDFDVPLNLLNLRPGVSAQL